MQGVFLELLILLHHEYLIIIADSSLDVKSLQYFLSVQKEAGYRGEIFRNKPFLNRCSHLFVVVVL